ncbi:hypothetical protein PX554_18065 [Sphingomonas sp. H39-1-10]|uniref:hypothetical protein n=1 Tax=Sphingomonas pollutisoli TaxID=3030829 RepID=UPI0023BA225A|nr:hypothetical protein [Sphingomonas pollutisoli]MDF0490043.1 hypothetical protein [Sphingomonas pollutisoli]
MNAAIEGLVARSTASGWVLCILVVGGLFQQWRMWTSQRPKMRELENAEDASLRADLMRMLAEARTDHANQIADIRREQQDERHACDEKLRAMQAQIDGLVRQLIAAQVMTGRALEMSPEVRAAGERAMRVRDEGSHE